MPAAAKTENGTIAKPAPADKVPDPVSAPSRDQEYHDFALAAAVAISERIDANHPVHNNDDLQSTLFVLARSRFERYDNSTPMEKRAVEKAIYRNAKILAQSRVAYQAKLIVARMAVTKDPRGENYHTLKEDTFVRVVSGRQYGHPLPFSHQIVKEWYNNTVNEFVAKALQKYADPTPTEMLAAKIILYEDSVFMDMSPADRQKRIAPAFAEVFKSGSLTPANAIRTEREKLTADLPQIHEPPAKSEADKLLVRVFRAFTHREINDMATSSTSAAVNDSALAPRLKHITETAGGGKSTYAWHPAAEQLEQLLQPARLVSELQFYQPKPVVISTLRRKLGLASPVPDQCPQNIAPWSHELLDSDPPEAVSRPRRVYECWLRLLAHPRTRFETLAWHR